MFHRVGGLSICCLAIACDEEESDGDLSDPSNCTVSAGAAKEMIRPCYRGQADLNWPLHSAAIRRLATDLATSNWTDEVKAARTEAMVRHPSIAQKLRDYHCEELLEPARNLGLENQFGSNLSDLQLLSRLQHFGAATGLLDFTWDPLIALWFACDKPEKDGRVFVVDLGASDGFRLIPSDTKEQEVDAVFARDVLDYSLYWEPVVDEVVAARIIGQKSVFVIGQPLIEETLVTRVDVSVNDKPKIKEELSKVFRVDEHFLNRDFYGFAQVNQETAPIRLMRSPRHFFEKGNLRYQVKDYEAAIGSYDRCISLNSDVRQPFFNRGNAKAAIGDYQGAIEDYDKGLLCPRIDFWHSDDTRVVADLDLAKIFFNRGNANTLLEQHVESREDFRRAIEHDQLET